MRLTDLRLLLNLTTMRFSRIAPFEDTISISCSEILVTALADLWLHLISRLANKTAHNPRNALKLPLTQ